MLFWALIVALSVTGTACRRSVSENASTTASALTVRDVDGHAVRLAGPARRIVSFFPSATDLLVALGARDRLVGRSTYDTDTALRALPVLGGTVQPSLEPIAALAPDLVIAWDGLNDDHLRERLAASRIPTVSLRMMDTADVFQSIGTLGQLLGRDAAAAALTADLRADLAGIARSVADRPPRSVFYVAWHDPPMTAGLRTFTGQLIAIAGGRTIFPELTQGWPTLSLEEVVRRQPEVLIVPVGDLPVTSAEALGRLPGWRDLAAVQQRRIVHLPVELVNRPGPRLAEAARALRDALHPEAAKAAR